MLPTTNDSDADWGTEGELDPLPLDPQSPEFRAFDRFVELTERKRALEDKLEQCKEQLKVMELQLRDYLANVDGGFKLVVARGHSVFLRRALYASKRKEVPTPKVCALLKAHDLGQFVYETYSSKALSSHILELERIHEEDFKSGRYTTLSDVLPPPVAAVMNVDPTLHVIALARRK